jgi:acyl transferase domain-containing protein
MVASLGSLYALGRELDWSKVQSPGQTVELPTYAFDRQRYWLEGGGQGAQGAGLASSGHPLLGSSVETASTGGRVFATKLSRRSPSWLRDHQVFGEVVVPGTAFLEMCRAAVERARPRETQTVRDLTLVSPLLLPESGSVNVQVEVLESEGAGGLSVEVYSRFEDDEERTASGRRRLWGWRRLGPRKRRSCSTRASTSD